MHGFLWALVFLLCVMTPVFFGPGVKFQGILRISDIANAIILGFGVGFAEELIFRGWLWKELTFLFGPKRGLVFQAMIFSLAHLVSLLKSNLDWIELLALLVGLFLLGLVLSLRRILDKGFLGGCICLHGGLVGLWFYLNAGLIGISDSTPRWMIGPGDVSPNPIGSFISIFCLLLTLFYYRTAFAIAGRPCKGDRSASSKGAIP